MNETPSTRPDVLTGPTRRISTPCGSGLVTLNQTADGTLTEVFFRVGKPGECRKLVTNVISKLVTRCLRYGVEPEEIVKDFMGEECQGYDGSPNGNRSCVDALAKAIVREQEKKGDNQSA